jgi:hypothetical protein
VPLSLASSAGIIPEMEVIMARTTDEDASLEEHRTRCGYRVPPRELWPSDAPEWAGGEWDDLYAWFKENTDDANTALLVFLADHDNVSIGVSYEATDGWAKHRAATDDDGVYMSFN